MFKNSLSVKKPSLFSMFWRMLQLSRSPVYQAFLFSWHWDTYFSRELKIRGLVHYRYFFLIFKCVLSTAAGGYLQIKITTNTQRSLWLFLNGLMYLKGSTYQFELFLLSSSSNASWVIKSKFCFKKCLTDPGLQGSWSTVGWSRIQWGALSSPRTERKG